MLSNRKNLILKIIVEEYIENAEPVGSRTLSKLEELNCSSATIRNEMADLEDLGYLEKTHVSSGRIPSEKGYRYYIENLLDFDENEYYNEIDLEEIFNNQNKTTEEIITETVELVSDLTNYTSIVLGPDGSKNIIKRIEFVKLSNDEGLLIIVTDSGHIENKRFVINEQYDVEKIRQVVEVLNKVLYNSPLEDASRRINYELDHNDLLNYIDFKDKLLDLFIKVFDSFRKDNYLVKGEYNLLNAPEFNDVESIKQLVNAVETKQFLSLVNRDDNNNNLSITIGSENNIEFMENCTLISVPYYLKGGDTGKIAVLGPKRMNYKKVIPLLKCIADNMEKLK